MSIAPFALIADADTREQSKQTLDNEHRTKSPGDHQNRVSRLLRRLPGAGTGYRDSLFERPDVVEDDYYRFINGPRGW